MILINECTKTARFDACFAKFKIISNFSNLLNTEEYITIMFSIYNNLFDILILIEAMLKLPNHDIVGISQTLRLWLTTIMDVNTITPI